MHLVFLPYRMSTALLTPSAAPSATRRRGQAEVERLLEELRRRVEAHDVRTEPLRWQIAEAVKADLARAAA
jgi:hypothetical protein